MQLNMKRILQIAALAIVIVVGSSLRNKAAAQTYGEVSYQTFYDELSPYGRWVDNQEYGYVWVPDAGPDFRPYSTDGHWVWTDDYEWMWVSDYDWGWAPFHYGRWTMDPYYGWIWVPGYEWSPAWVAWRSGGDYYGWAPLRPGISISINFRIGRLLPFDRFSFSNLLLSEGLSVRPLILTLSLLPLLCLSMLPPPFALSNVLGAVLRDSSR